MRIVHHGPAPDLGREPGGGHHVQVIAQENIRRAEQQQEEKPHIELRIEKNLLLEQDPYPPGLVAPRIQRQALPSPGADQQDLVSMLMQRAAYFMHPLVGYQVRYN